MRKLTYWSCFALVAVANLLALASFTLYQLGFAFPTGLWTLVVSIVGSFALPMPLGWFPVQIVSIFELGVLLLVLRRVWLAGSKNDRVPTSYKGGIEMLGYAGVMFFALGLFLVGVSFIFRTGTTQLSSFLLIPGYVCIPWAWLLAEVLSFRHSVPVKTISSR